MSTKVALFLFVLLLPLGAIGADEELAIALEQTFILSAPQKGARPACAVEVSTGDRISLRKPAQEFSGWQFVQALWSTCQASPGWVPSTGVASHSEFQPVKSWIGPKGIRLESGDWAGQYSFTSDGRFVLKDWNDYLGKESEYKGRLFSKGNVIWARPDGPEGNSGFGDIFVHSSDRTLCWSNDKTICAK